MCICLGLSANMYMIDDSKQSGKSLICIKNNKCPKILLQIVQVKGMRMHTNSDTLLSVMLNQFHSFPLTL